MTYREVVLAVDGLDMSDKLQYSLFSRLSMAVAASGFNPKAGTFVKKLFPDLTTSGKMDDKEIQRRREIGLKMLEKLNNGRRSQDTGRGGRNAGRKGAG